MAETLITTEDESALSQQDMPTLAEWWSALNGWEWPSDLPNPEPQRNYVPNDRRIQLMRWIEGAIGLRAIFHQWHVVRDKRMTEEQFNDFWRGNFEGHKPSRVRELKRIEEIVRQESRR